MRAYEHHLSLVMKYYPLHNAGKPGLGMQDLSFGIILIWQYMEWHHTGTHRFTRWIYIMCWQLYCACRNKLRNIASHCCVYSSIVSCWMCTPHVESVITDLSHYIYVMLGDHNTIAWMLLHNQRHIVLYAYCTLWHLNKTVKLSFCTREARLHLVTI